MTYWLSKPIEVLLAQVQAEPDKEQITDKTGNLVVDTLIVGSGYGAAMAALALSESGDGGRIAVFERGQEYLPQDFPRTLGELPAYVPNNASGNSPSALWDVRMGEGAVSITGSGLGGTSLVNAAVAVPPDKETLDSWPASGVDTDWSDLFARCYPKINQLLGVNQIEDPGKFAKYHALSRTVAAIDNEAQVQPAPVAINFNNSTPHSVDHKPCNHCGNCVIGCHSGAKQSLNLNAWPLAVQQGVSLYTGVKVNRLSVHKEQWRVWFSSTGNTVDTAAADVDKPVIIAKRVILAAGAIGSTEILKRSQQGYAADEESVGGLNLSPLLGKRFSANGDGLIFTSGEGTPVNAVADVPDETATPECGPTIIGIARAHSSYVSSGKVTIEDGAIPYPLAKLWRETLTMQSYVGRFVNDKESAWHSNNPLHDPLETSNDFTNHGQVLLTMGFDGSPGELIEDAATGNLLPKWPKPQTAQQTAQGGQPRYYKQLHQVFETLKPGAYAGGEYHANPMYQALPGDFSQVFAGVEGLPQSVVTVHPLGGCVIGQTAETGVVNHNGQVFCCNNSNDPAAVYKDLYVLDGAALPTAVGVNPMIAISALSYTLASRIAGRMLPDKTPFQQLQPEYRQLPELPVKPVDRDNDIHAEFNERLLWPLKESIANSTAFKNVFGNLIPANSKTVLLDVSFYFDDKDHKGQRFNNSLDKWLTRPATPLRAKAVLRASDRSLLHGSADTFVPMPQLLQLEGTVTLASRGQQKHRWTWYRTATAIMRFGFYRTYAFVNEITAAFAKDNKATKENKPSRADKLRGFLRVAKLHSDWRYLEYELRETNSDLPLRVSGRKKLAYTLTSASLWESLLQLPVNISRDNAKLKAVFDVDLLRMTRGPAPLQISKSPDGTAGITAGIGFGLLLARLVGTTHFWSFGAHKYKKFISADAIDEQRLRKPPGSVTFKHNGVLVSSLAVETFTLEDPDQPDELLARLLRYRQDTTDRPAVLLVHGLSHSSEIFWPPHIRETYVEFLLKRGYDVWVFDHRASANTRKKINIDHTWDDIALVDVCWGVSKVFEQINRSRPSGAAKLVNVFSHCIGAGAVAMAVLAGKLQQPDDSSRSMLGSLVPHAVTPWVFSSCENRTRANLWGFAKDFNLLDKIDPRMHNAPSFVDTLLDRVASSTIDLRARSQWPWLKNQLLKRGEKNEHAMAMYFRYTVFWGRQWVNKNIPDKLKTHFPTMVGEVSATILQQIYYCVRRNRLVSNSAENSYVREESFKKYWTFPTLFLHGENNLVFDVESSRLSAYRLWQIRKQREQNSSSQPSLAFDYSRCGISLCTVPDYGHMDMIIGDKASAVVGPVLDDFLQASEAQHRHCHSEPSAVGRYDAFAAWYTDRRKHQNATPPLTRTSASKFPLTGPVLSIDADKKLKLWVEADDYDTEAPTGLKIFTSTDHALQVEQHSFEHAGKSQYGVFPGLDICDPENISDALEIRLTHADDTDSNSVSANDLTTQACNLLERNAAGHFSSQDIVRQRDIDHDRGVELRIDELAWFKRLYKQQEQNPVGTISFLAGSCLHPGFVLSRDLSDSIFENLWQQIVARDGPDFLLLLGDQIYADATAGLFDPKANYERYRMRYREAFGARGMRQVLSHIPTYFVLDDHAYKDNFSGVTQISEVAELDVAKAEALNFQTRLNNTGKFWSDFEVHQQPFFCFDTRFDRDSTLQRTLLESLIGDDQAAEFNTWVDKNKACKTLFICTGSPVLPISRDFVRHPEMSPTSDTLIAYSGFLKFFIETLADYSGKVVLLSGDPHLSCRGSATLSLRGKDHSVMIESIVASPLNGPFPFANAKEKDFLWRQDQQIRLPGGAVEINFNQQLLSTSAQQFCQIDYSKITGQIDVRVYSTEELESARGSGSFT